MLKEEFIQQVEGSDVLKVKEEKKDSFVIFNEKTKIKYNVTFDSIDDSDWSNLSSVLQGRDATIMDGITRIVGYFSRTSNWNKSKIGELHDRRKGNYNISSSC